MDIKRRDRTSHACVAYFVECLKWRNCICILCFCATAGRRLGDFRFLFRCTLASCVFCDCRVHVLSSYVSLKITLASLHEDKPRRMQLPLTHTSLIHLFLRDEARGETEIL